MAEEIGKILTESGSLVDVRLMTDVDDPTTDIVQVLPDVNRLALCSAVIPENVRSQVDGIRSKSTKKFENILRYSFAGLNSRLGAGWE